MTKLPMHVLMREIGKLAQKKGLPCIIGEREMESIRNSTAKVGLFDKISLDERTGCWNWTGAHHPRGYGQVRFMGRQRYVHTVSAELYLGYDPNSGLMVLHRCDNPRCFNPKHLFFGTQTDNMQDMTRKGRHHQLLKTHCPKGHPYSGHNVLARQTGRGCRECHNASIRVRRARKRDTREVA